MLQKLVDEQSDMKLLYLLDEQIKLHRLSEDIILLQKAAENK